MTWADAQLGRSGTRGVKVRRGFGHGRVRRRAGRAGPADTGTVPVVIVVLVALLVAAAVLVVVGVTTEHERDAEGGWQAFRRGLRGRRHPDDAQREAARAASADPVDLSLADFLRATVSEGDGYLHPDEISDDLQRARERAAQVLRARREQGAAQDPAPR
jgi:hypothetical protein